MTKQMKTEPLTVYLTPADLAALKTYCDAQQPYTPSLSEAVRHALRLLTADKARTRRSA